MPQKVSNQKKFFTALFSNNKLIWAINFYRKNSKQEFRAAGYFFAQYDYLIFQFSLIWMQTWKLVTKPQKNLKTTKEEKLRRKQGRFKNVRMRHQLLENSRRLLGEKRKNIIRLVYQSGIIFCKLKEKEKFIKTSTESGVRWSTVSFKIAIVKFYPKSKKNYNIQLSKNKEFILINFIFTLSIHFVLFYSNYL